jgi:hypothetical protein
VSEHIIIRGYSTKTFSEKHCISASRVRQLLRDERIYPPQKVGERTWYIEGNTVIIPPWESVDRKADRSIRLWNRCKSSFSLSSYAVVTDCSRSLGHDSSQYD